MRLFVAVQVPPEIRARGAQIAAEMLPAGLPVRRVAEKNMHITVKFLGEIDAQREKEIEKALSAVQFDIFTASISGFGAFPSLSRPNAIWLGCESGGLGALAGKIDDALAPLGFPKEKFSGHLTIARAKAGCGLREFANKYAAAEFGAFEVSSFALVQSTLAQGGPAYGILKEFGARKQASHYP